MFDNQEEYNKCRDEVLRLLKSGQHDSILLALQMQSTFNFEEVGEAIRGTIYTFFTDVDTNLESEYIALMFSNFYNVIKDNLKLYCGKPTFSIYPHTPTCVRFYGMDDILFPNEDALCSISKVQVFDSPNVLIDTRNLTHEFTLELLRCSIQDIVFSNVNIPKVVFLHKTEITAQLVDMLKCGKTDSLRLSFSEDTFFEDNYKPFLLTDLNVPEIVITDINRNVEVSKELLENIFGANSRLCTITINNEKYELKR